MQFFKRNYLFVVIFFIAVLFNFVFASPVEKTTPAIANKMITENSAIIVDVREVSEQNQGRIKKSISLPMSIMDTNKLEFEKEIEHFPKDKTIIVYCHSGRRAGLVGAELEKKGFKVLNLGGFESWKSLGLPVE